MKKWIEDAERHYSIHSSGEAKLICELIDHIQSLEDDIKVKDEALVVCLKAFQALGPCGACIHDSASHKAEQALALTPSDSQTKSHPGSE